MYPVATELGDTRTRCTSGNQLTGVDGCGVIELWITLMDGELQMLDPSKV